MLDVDSRRGTRPEVHAPARSMAQRMAALANANKIRTARAQLKRDVKAGRITFADVVLDPPEYVGTMKVFDLLVEVPKVGRVKANRVFVQARISPSKSIAGLSERQRGEIVGLVGR